MIKLSEIIKLLDDKYYYYSCNRLILEKDLYIFTFKAKTDESKILNFTVLDGFVCETELVALRIATKNFSDVAETPSATMMEINPNLETYTE